MIPEYVSPHVNALIFASIPVLIAIVAVFFSRPAEKEKK